MSKIPFVVITGAPATGKTTVGRRVAASLSLPYISKDGLKETLFDSIGWGDRDWSRKLGMAAMDLLFYLAERQLEASRPFVVESNFYPEFHTIRFLDLIRAYPCVPIQILCQTDSQILAKRFHYRATSGERHPGHLDPILFLEFDVEQLLRTHGSLDIGGYALKLDTSAFDAIDYDALLRTIWSVWRNLS